MVDSDGARVAEVVIGDLLRVQTVHTDVDVQVRLDIVPHLSRTLELLPRPPHAVRQRLVPRRNPTALHARPLLLVALLLLVLAEEGSDGLDGLLGVDLLETARRLSSLHELGDRPRPQRVALPGDPSLVLRSVIGELLHCRVLRQSGLEVRPVHQHLPLPADLLRVLGVDDAVGDLVWLHLRVRVDRSPADAAGVLVEGLSHVHVGGLVFVMRELGTHDRRRVFLSGYGGTIPSSRTMRLWVSHLGLRSSRGSARWKEVPSKVVMASSLERGWVGREVPAW